MIMESVDIGAVISSLTVGMVIGGLTICLMLWAVRKTVKIFKRKIFK